MSTCCPNFRSYTPTYPDMDVAGQNFPWDEFDARGLELAKELKAFLGPDQYLEYQDRVIE